MAVTVDRQPGQFTAFLTKWPIHCPNKHGLNGERSITYTLDDLQRFYGSGHIHADQKLYLGLHFCQMNMLQVWQITSSGTMKLSTTFSCPIVCRRIFVFLPARFSLSIRPTVQKDAELLWSRKVYVSRSLVHQPQ